MAQFSAKKSALALVVASLLAMGVAKAEEKVSTTGWDSLGKIMSDVVNPILKKEGVEATYTPVEGDFQKFLLNGLSADTAPDLFYVDIAWARPIFESGKVAELPEAEFTDILDNMPQSLKDAFYYNGKLYGIAKDFATLAIAYNKDLFDDAKVEYPNNEDTWDTLAEKLAKIRTALGDEFYGTCLPTGYDRFGALAFAYGWEPFNAEGKTVLDDKFAKALSFYKGLLDNGAGVIPSEIGQSWTGGCLSSEKVAIAIEGAWVVGFLRDNAPFMNYGSAMMPKGPTGERGNFLYTVAWSMKNDVANRDAAIKTIKALVSLETQTHRLENYGAIPIDKDLSKFPYMTKEGKENAFVRASYEGSQQGVVQPFNGGQHGGKWMDVISDVIKDVMVNKKSVEEAIASGQAKLDKL